VDAVYTTHHQMLPNLIVIGAMRGGTTSLHRYLGSHPEIFMSSPKELNFFVAENNWHRGEGWYRNQFPEGTKVRGESSPFYTMYPSRPDVPERIAKLIPRVKLVYLVRDPIDRLVSHYRFLRFARGIEKRTLEDALDDLGTSQYVATSMYAMQLERYLAYFPRELILVVDSADLASRRVETLRSVFRFLEVDDMSSNTTFNEVLNATDAPWNNRLGRLLARADRVVGGTAAREVRRRLPRPLEALVARTPPQLVVDSALHDRLTRWFREDVAGLRTLTGMRFDSWSI
jgi:hypothetical protein